MGFGVVLFSAITLQSPLAFASSVNSQYTVTFSATGVDFLGAGPDNIYPIHFVVSINGQTYSALTNHTIRVILPAGSYTWSASPIKNQEPCTECPDFWQASPNSGTITIARGEATSQVTHIVVTYVDEVSFSISVPLSNGSSDGYPVKSVSTNPSLPNIVIRTGQYWEASGYLAYGTPIRIHLVTTTKYTAYAFDEWGAIMVCTSSNRFAENTILYASDNCQFQALFNPTTQV